MVQSMGRYLRRRLRIEAFVADPDCMLRIAWIELTGPAVLNK